MHDLEENIINLFGARGKQWLHSLPQVTQYLSDHWQLTNVETVDNLTWNYVAKAMSEIDGAVVFKVSCDEKLIDDEVRALEYFSGHGMVELIQYDAKYHAVLLRQAISGKSLLSMSPDKVTETIRNYSDIVKQLISVPQKNHSSFRHISDWLKAFDRVDKMKCPNDLFEKAVDLKNHLLASSGKEFVLHGDLHHDNILSDGDGWIAIDPKGVVGTVEFEAAGFDFIHKSEWHSSNVPQLFEERSKWLVDALGLDHQRLKNWVFVRLMLGACWMIEDNGKPDIFFKQARHLFPYIIA